MEVKFSLYFTNMPFEHEYACMKTLNDHNATKQQRFGLVCAFFGHGYSIEDTIFYIRKYQTWNDFNLQKTEEQVRKIYKQLEHNKSKGTGSFLVANSCSPSTDDVPKPTWRDIVKKFMDGTKPVFYNPPDDIWDAVKYYHSIGLHPWAAGEDKRPMKGRRWKKYQDEQPSMCALGSLDWRYGILLLGTMKHSFLDIDVKSEKHQDGLIDFDENILSGWQHERSKNNGYHFFGLGGFPKGISGLKISGCELKHTGGYIVTYPTPGYMINRIKEK